MDFTDTERPTRVRATLYVLTVVLLSGLMIRIFVVDSFTVKGNSMAPTIVDGEYVFVNKLAYDGRAPERDDIVVGNFRGMSSVKVIKRVIGLPREWVAIDAGSVRVGVERENVGEEVAELKDLSLLWEASTTPERFMYRLDPYEYFLIGDAGLSSVDSRELGPVDSYHIDGRVFLKTSLKDFSYTIY